MKRNLQSAKETQKRSEAVIDSKGAWHFATRVKLRLQDGRFVLWHSRHNRKQFVKKPIWVGNWRLFATILWMPRDANWWIGVLFAFGAGLFMHGCVLFLYPLETSGWLIVEKYANSVFFLGSLFLHPRHTYSCIKRLTRAQSVNLTRQHTSGLGGDLLMLDG